MVIFFEIVLLYQNHVHHLLYLVKFSYSKIQPFTKACTYFRLINTDHLKNSS